MPEQNTASIPKQVSKGRGIAFLQLIEGISEGIYVVGTFFSLAAFFLGISIVGAPVLIALGVVGVVGFVTIAVATKYRSHKKRLQTLKTAVEREQSSLNHMINLEKIRLAQLLQEQNDVSFGKKIIDQGTKEQLETEIKSLQNKVSAYNQATPPPAPITTKTTLFFKIYEHFYNGLAGIKRSFTLRNVAATTLLLVTGLVAGPMVAIAFTGVLAAILLTSRIITRNNEKKIPQDVKTVNASAEKIEKLNIELRAKIELSNRQALGVENFNQVEKVTENKPANPSVNKINTASTKIKRNKLITAMQVFEGVVEALYIVGSIASILAFFFGLAVVGSPFLIAAGAIGSLFFLGASITAKYRTDTKSHDNLTSALSREQAAIKTYNELYPENRHEKTTAVKEVPTKPVVDRLSNLYEYAYQGLAAFKRGFTVRTVLGTVLLLAAGAVFNAPAIIVAALVISTLMAGSRIITRSHEKKMAEKTNSANKLAENLEKKNITRRTQDTFQTKKALATEVEMSAPESVAQKNMETKCLEVDNLEPKTDDTVSAPNELTKHAEIISTDEWSSKKIEMSYVAQKTSFNTKEISDIQGLFKNNFFLDTSKKSLSNQKLIEAEEMKSISSPELDNLHMPEESFNPFLPSAAIEVY